jgi:gliding motility-associated lipoprotein GldB
LQITVCVCAFFDAYIYIKKKMKKASLKLILLGTVIVALVSCNKSSRFEIDTKKNRVEVKIHRFDKDLLSIDTSRLNTGVDSLYTRYPEFLSAFSENILDTASTDTVAVRHQFKLFLTDKTFAPVNKKAKQTYGDISDIETKVSEAYTYIHHYFPEVQLPEVYFFVSGFNRQVMMSDKFIGIGTDFYLGNDFKLYKSLTYKYMIFNMRRENIASDLVSATLFRMFVMNSDENRLLDNMLYRGKVMYLLSVFMPEEKPDVLMGYSPEQWKWCKKYEKSIWTAIIDQKHLFSTDVQLIHKYMNDAPFTATISQESPGRLGTFIGWQIVKSYMDKNKQVGLKELMNEENYQRLLENSGYRP